MAHSERPHQTRAEMARAVRWKSAPSGATTKQHRDSLWTSLREFIERAGASVSSVPFTWPIRIDIPIDSPLPERLRALGHDIAFCEQVTRLNAPTAQEPGRYGRPRDVNNAYSFDSFDVFYLKLPK
jgi:hypothetical protein